MQAKQHDIWLEKPSIVIGSEITDCARSIDITRDAVSLPAHCGRCGGGRVMWDGLASNPQDYPLFVALFIMSDWNSLVRQWFQTAPSEFRLKHIPVAFLFGSHKEQASAWKATVIELSQVLERREICQPVLRRSNKARREVSHSLPG